MAKEIQPHYENEVSIYERETLHKIKEFRSARSNFGTQKNINQTMYANVKKGLDDSNVYKGRCLCLRRLRLRTTFLLDHFKTLKPLRYYTLKKKLTDYQKFNTKIKPGRVEDEDKTLRTLEETCSFRSLWTAEELEECYKDAHNIKEKKARITKKKECKKKGPSGPCKEVIRKLKAAKVKGGIIESCKCEDGREVTVVIKGICLCNKGSLNNINLNKVCDEYSKMAIRIPEGKVPHTMNTSETHEEPPSLKSMREHNEQKNNEINKPKAEKNTVLVNQEGNAKGEEKMISKVDSIEGTDFKTSNEVRPPSAVDSFELYKKRKDTNTHLEFNEKLPDEVDRTGRASNKRITFKPVDLKSEKTEKTKLNTGSDITLYPKYSSAGATGVESDEIVKADRNISDSLRNLLIDVEYNKEVENKVKGVNNKSEPKEPKKHPKTEPVLARPGVTNGEALTHDDSLEIFGKNISGKISDKKKEVHMPDSKSKINDTLKQEKQTPFPEINAGNDNSSMISLYRNKPEEKSNMALTKEEFEKIKKQSRLHMEKTQ